MAGLQRIRTVLPAFFLAGALLFDPTAALALSGPPPTGAATATVAPPSHVLSPTASVGVIPTPTATPAATSTAVGLATATVSALATASPTASATPSPTPIPVLVTGITPSSAGNDAPVSVTLTGSGFTTGMAVTIGGRPLSDIQLHSSRELAGTLRPGLCPGTYAATVSLPGGPPASGGQLALHGVRTATFGAAVAGPSVALDGTDRHLGLPLPAVHLLDTTCGGGDWRVRVEVGAPSGNGRDRPIFRPQAVVLSTVGSTKPAATLDLSRSDSGIIIIPRTAGQTTADLTAYLDVLVPGNSYAGRQAVPVSVTLLDAG